MVPENMAVLTWSGQEIPEAVREAIQRENLQELVGTYGQGTAPRPLEYDHLRIVLADGVADITVFNRRALLAKGNAKFQRVHRVLCKLNEAIMAGMPVSAQRVGANPHLPLPPDGKFTYRDQANVLTLLAFRNGPIEDLHAGKDSPLLEDKALSRITDAEMKTLMIAASSKLAELLALRDDDPESFAALLAGNWHQVRNWER
jgi:hypothetical protein